MSWKDGPVWVAVCIDLTLAAQGDTPHEAKHRLHAQIAEYVHEAMTLDAKHANALLTRRASLYHRALFTFWNWVDNRPRLRRKAGSVLRQLRLAVHRRLAYNDPLPMCPA